jgi:gas vesicle protein
MGIVIAIVIGGLIAAAVVVFVAGRSGDTAHTGATVGQNDPTVDCKNACAQLQARLGDRCSANLAFQSAQTDLNAINSDIQNDATVLAALGAAAIAGAAAAVANGAATPATAEISGLIAAALWHLPF